MLISEKIDNTAHLQMLKKTKSQEAFSTFLHIYIFSCDSIFNLIQFYLSFNNGNFSFELVVCSTITVFSLKKKSTFLHFKWEYEIKKRKCFRSHLCAIVLCSWNVSRWEKRAVKKTDIIQACQSRIIGSGGR